MTLCACVPICEYGHAWLEGIAGARTGRLSAGAGATGSSAAPSHSQAGLQNTAAARGVVSKPNSPACQIAPHAPHWRLGGGWRVFCSHPGGSLCGGWRLWRHSLSAWCSHRPTPNLLVICSSFCRTSTSACASTTTLRRRRFLHGSTMACSPSSPWISEFESSAEGIPKE